MTNERLWCGKTGNMVQYLQTLPQSGFADFYSSHLTANEVSESDER